MKDELLAQLRADRASKTPAVLATFLKSGEQRLLYLYGKKGTSGLDPAVAEAARAAIVGDRPTTVETAEGPVFLNVFNPPLRMAIVGAVHITQALAPMAALAGYEVRVIDPRRAFGSEQRFPGVDLSNAWPDEAMAEFKPDLRSAVVTLTHDPKLDDPALAAALRSDAFYIGALGSKKTHAARLERLRQMGFPDHELARIRGPVGLSLGAKSPAEIAVSVLAQVIQTLRQRAAAEEAAA
jgi:xanthine dehydrogenase accessory factor